MELLGMELPASEGLSVGQSIGVLDRNRGGRCVDVHGSFQRLGLGERHMQSCVAMQGTQKQITGEGANTGAHKYESNYLTRRLRTQAAVGAAAV